MQVQKFRPGTVCPPAESVSAETYVPPPGLLNVIAKLAPGEAAKVLLPEDKFAAVSWTFFTLEPNRPNVYAPTTSAKTSVPAIRMIVAITGVIPFLRFLKLSLFMETKAFEAHIIR